MAKTAINQFDITPGNNTDVDGVGVGASMTVDNTNDAFQHLMALIAQQMGEVGALSADIASAATTDLSAARGWFVNITGTNSISALGTVPAGKIFRLRFVNGLTLTYSASMILPNATNFAAAAGDIVTMLSLGSGNWRFVDYSPAGGGALPAGSIVDFGGTVAPGGWLLCNGQLVEAVALTTAQLASHSHGGVTGLVSNDHSHAQTGTFNTGTESADHTHSVTVHNQTSGGLFAGGAVGPLALPSDQAFTTSGRSAAHFHSVTISGQTGGISANHNHSISAEGSGSAHSNVQPSLICAKIIKF
jgi:hypothetical protein